MSEMYSSTGPKHALCQLCLAKDEIIRAKDAVIAAKDDAIVQKDLALKAEREIRDQLQRQLKLATQAVTKKTGIINIKSASCQAQEEKDALTIYIRNVTESVTYDMLYDAFSTFGTIRTLNVVHPKACAFVEFTTADAHQKALAASSVKVGDGHENVLTEKRVRRQQQGFTKRSSTNNLRGFNVNGGHQQLQQQHSTFSSHPTSSQHQTISHGYGQGTTTTATASPPSSSTRTEALEVTSKLRESWNKKEDEGCDVASPC
ncbi:hypothetical protein DFQ27_003210 [Actinomortierella ambigua]|uniref:RRM domain-containing protein n=1 Tax=Actinomortierella ambigua TaxID=1343610 RepID=A0A9P6QI78_9FUNG|nr:hypothetical protein DFQ27_003210 [Actinomortierella ambigua]